MVRVFGTWCQNGEPDTVILIHGDHYIRINVASDFLKLIDGRNVPTAVREDRLAEARRAAASAERERREAAEVNRQRLDARRQRLKAKGWSSQAIETIIAGKIYIGMTAEMVREAWGRPRDINRTITAAGIHEQWVYGTIRNANYVYLDNGIVTAIQN